MLPPVRGGVPGPPLHCLQQDPVRQVSNPHNAWTASEGLLEDPALMLSSRRRCAPGGCPANCLDRRCAVLYKTLHARVDMLPKHCAWAALLLMRRNSSNRCGQSLQPDAAYQVARCKGPGLPHLLLQCIAVRMCECQAGTMQTA